METSVARKRGSLRKVLDVSAPVTILNEYKQDRIDNVLNSVVYVRGRGNVLMKELFSPLSSAAVVIRRSDGSYTDPCDFQSYLREMKKGASIAKEKLYERL